MSKAIPHISKYMTAMPQTIEPHQSISEAKKIMQDLNVRHLPVVAGKELVGILSDGDINLISSLKDINVRQSHVSDAMKLKPFVVRPETLLDEACGKMAEEKIGSAVVAQENGTIVGIFTYVDALRTLSEIFSTRLKK